MGKINEAASSAPTNRRRGSFSVLVRKNVSTTRETMQDEVYWTLVEVYATHTNGNRAVCTVLDEKENGPVRFLQV